jgi:hypothetical protein
MMNKIFFFLSRCDYFLAFDRLSLVFVFLKLVILISFNISFNVM